MRIEETSIDFSPFDVAKISESKASLEEQAYYALKAIIDVLGLKPGDQLPDTEQLAQMIGVNRQVIKRALNLLKAQGMVTIRPRYGTRIAESTARTEYHPEKQLESTARMLKIAGEADIECAAVAAAYGGRCVKDIDAALERWTSTLNSTTAASLLSIYTADAALHRQIRSAPIGEAGWVSLHSLARVPGNLAFLGAASLIKETYKPPYIQQVTTDHQAIVKAIGQRDINAAKSAMSAHYDHIYEAANLPARIG